MLSNYVFRSAVIADIEKMVGLLDQLFSIEEDFEASPNKQVAGLMLLMESESAQLFVVEDSDGEVVAMASIQLVISTAEGGVVAWVEDVVVDLSHRGQGVGSTLLNYISEWAKDKDVKRLQLVADKNNQPALDFYAKYEWLKTSLLVMRRKPVAQL